jgi:tight adherence protein B
MSTEVMIGLIFGVLAIAVASMAYLVIMPFISGERRTEKRIQVVAQGKPNRIGSTRADDVANRRKQVQETLKEIEKKQKSKNKATLKMRLIRAGLHASPQQFFVASALTGALAMLGVMLFSGLSIWIAALVGFTAAFGLPRWILGFWARRRQAKFLLELANTIDIIVRGVKSGLPVGECLEIIARESSEPIKSEFAELVEGQRLGVSLADGFDRMMERMPVAEVNFLAIVIAIQQQAGGNLAEALGNLSGVLRARFGLKAKVAALSGEATASAAILGGLPFVVCAGVYFTSPDYIMLLFTDKIGHILLAVAAVMMTIGIYVMRTMINFKY